MDNLKFNKLGFTYDDVLLVPAYSEVLPREVNITSRFSKNVNLNIPIVSSAMDTVTESAMAIAIAREGGIGVLHKNMTIEAQAKQVRKVKRAENGMITDPVTLSVNSSVLDAKNSMIQNGIGGIPVIDEDNLLKGIITNRDLRFEKEDDKPITELMTTELVVAPQGTDLKKAEQILNLNRIEKLPIVNKKNQLMGLITYRDITKLTKKSISNKDKQGRLRVSAAVGVSRDVLERTNELIKVDVDVIVIDTAHGHSKSVIEVLKKIKQTNPQVDVVVGNIATGEAAKLLVKNGADGVKVGIGPGSICTTRIIAGVGYPQFSAIYEVSKSIAGSNVPVIADGGIRYTGDITKAMAAGADCVMLGSLLAGTKESPGETIIYEGRKFKSYRGMGSISAMKQGSKDRYFQDMESDIKKLVPEGIEGRVPYKGELSESMQQFLGGIRAGMSYCGAKTIADIKKARFVQITASGVNESHPHNVIITKESPNYTRK